MTYTSFGFYVFLVIILVLYYVFPLKYRWYVLLLGSVIFYLSACKNGWWILVGTVIFTYCAGLFITFLNRRFPNSKIILKGIVLAGAIMGCILPWLGVKGERNIVNFLLAGQGWTWVAPLGISFYTLQMVSYLVDVYKEKVVVQRNIGKYLLFILFFPQIIQGPIPRYEQLEEQLYEGNRFDENKLVEGFQLIVWGFFLKLVIADKANVIVDTVFDNPLKYAGCYIWIAGILYSVELYTNFLSCVVISKGVASLFGIQLTENFWHPYFATSIKEFWRRWHISLSEWLRDYIYIPLGGNKKGRHIKYLNLVVTFIISGIWHGAGVKFIFWGVLHAVYQIVGDITTDLKEKIYRVLGLHTAENIRRVIQRMGTFFWVTIAWIIFRADSLEIGLRMIKDMFRVYNPWILYNNQIFSLGLNWKEWCVLVIAIFILIFVSGKQEKGISIRQYIMEKPIYIRWMLYITSILCIMLFGTYGFGFDAQDFIYGGF